MHKLLLIISILFLAPISLSAHLICKVQDGGNVEIQSERLEGNTYVVSVMNDGEVNANIYIDIEYKVGKDKKISSGAGIARSLQTSIINIPCNSEATDIKVIAIRGTRCSSN